MSREREKAVLAELREAAARMQGDEWAFTNVGREFHLFTRRATGEEAHICTIHADALVDEQRLIVAALENLVLFLALFDRAANAVRDLQRRLGGRAEGERRKDFAAQAAMLLPSRQFQRFLEGKGAGGPVRDAGAADTRLKSILGLQSKSQLNSEAWAQEAWKRLTGEFEAWKRCGA